jgi:CHASE2 domain-containing sensor protein
MTPPPRLLLLCGAVPALCAVALSLLRPSFLAPLEYRTYDTLVRSGGTRPPSGRVVIVDVDERSLAAVGQWPWRRDVLARLVTRLRGMDASTWSSRSPIATAAGTRTRHSPARSRVAAPSSVSG